MKFKFIPLLLAAACAVLPAMSCSRSAVNKAENPSQAYYGAEADTSGSQTEEENTAKTQAELPAETSAEENTTEEIPTENSAQENQAEGQAENAADTQCEDLLPKENVKTADEPTEEQPEEPSETPSSDQTETTSPTDEETEGEEGSISENNAPAEEESEDSESEIIADNSEDTAIEKEENRTVLNTESEQAESTEEKAVYIKCICTDLNIRSGAGTEYTPIGKAEKGTLFAYLGTENGWYKTYYNGETAYISAYSKYTALVEIERGDEKTENVINVGLKLIGTKYVYGAVRLHDGNGNLLSGFTPTEFDCSSLIQYIFYYGADVILEVNTRTQIYQGEYVHPYSLQRGDCIYFTNSSRYNNNGVERVGHVALYLGDGYILHTAYDYCKIEKISEIRWNYYIEARRFI